MNSNLFHLFWGGPFSNWYPAKFEYLGQQFNCSEQAFMYEKAMMFGDDLTAEQILAAETPKEQKALGRKVQNFDQTLWDKSKYAIMRQILIQKFHQNPQLLDLLRQNKYKVFVEASPTDSIWGIGYSEKNAFQNVESWGQNLLGLILTELALEQ